MSSGKPLIGTSRETVKRVLRSSVVSNAVNLVAGFIVLPRVLHGIDVQRYGEWATLAAFLAIGQLVQAGVVTDVSRRVAAAHGEGNPVMLRETFRQAVTVLVGLAIVLEVIAVVIARPVVDLVFSTVSTADRGELTLLLIGVFTLFTIGLIGNGYFSILSGLQRSDYTFWSSAASIIVGAVATVTGVALGFGLWALFIADCIQLAVSWVGPFIGVRRLAPGLGFRLVRVSRVAIIAFIGMPAMLVMGSASDLFDSQIDKLVLTHSVGPAASAMFQIGTSLVQAVRGVALIPLGVMLAGTAELHRTDPNRLLRLERRADLSVQAIAAVSAGGLLLFSGPFVSAWLGTGYEGAVRSLRVLALAALLNAWSAPWTFYAIGRARYHYVLVAAGVTLVVNALATVFLTARIGLDGALIGSFAGSAAGTGTALLMLRRWEPRKWLSPALRATGVVAALVVPFFLTGTQPPASWLDIVAGALGYLLAAGFLLLITGSLPVKLVRHRTRLSLAWR